MTDSPSPKLAGQINRMQIKLARFEGEAAWSFREYEDELFFVHKGRLPMKFCDRQEVIEAGEFIVVPHGVEHCPMALESACEVLLIDPATNATRPASHTARAR